MIVTVQGPCVSRVYWLWEFLFKSSGQQPYCPLQAQSKNIWTQPLPYMFDWYGDTVVHVRLNQGTTWKWLFWLNLKSDSRFPISINFDEDQTRDNGSPDKLEEGSEKKGKRFPANRPNRNHFPTRMSYTGIYRFCFYAVVIMPCNVLLNYQKQWNWL